METLNCLKGREKIYMIDDIRILNHFLMGSIPSLFQIIMFDLNKVIDDYVPSSTKIKNKLLVDSNNIKIRFTEQISLFILCNFFECNSKTETIQDKTPKSGTYGGGYVPSGRKATG